MSKGYESLVHKVKIDCDNGEGCFNPNGCNHEFTRIVPAEGEDKKFFNTICKHISKCEHKYCDKFKWIIDRAKHYAEKTGLDWEEILDSWEEDCDYWYMNYYQDANQPLIEGDNVRVFETVNDLLEAIEDRKFRCPNCGKISTDPYECNSGAKMNNEEVCNWKVYGLFGDLGKGAFVYCKDKKKGEKIFMPIAWEKK